jgi:hypothetical protein
LFAKRGLWVFGWKFARRFGCGLACAHGVGLRCSLFGCSGGQRVTLACDERRSTAVAGGF